MFKSIFQFGWPINMQVQHERCLEMICHLHAQIEPIQLPLPNCLQLWPKVWHSWLNLTGRPKTCDIFSKLFQMEEHLHNTQHL